MSSLPITASHEIPPAPSHQAEARGGRRMPALLTLVRHAGFPVVVALEAVLTTHRLSQNGWANVFYSAGVRSMLRSWHNFMFVSFDPGGLISVDKPPLALWVQAASAKVFGFTPLAILLPEAILGVLTVALLYWIVARRLGAAAAFASAFTLAVFPSFVAVSRDNGVDPLLIFLMLAACGAGLRAAETGRVRWMIASGALIGLAFNTKTLAAFLAVPGIAAAYLICAPVSWRKRALGLLAGGVVLLVVSGAWIAYVEATPASKRPFVGSSTDNTQLGLTFEYNGFGRVEGQLGGPNDVKTLPGARPIFHHHTKVVNSSLVGAAHTPHHLSTFLKNGHYRNPFPFGAKPSPVRLWGKGLGDQDGWTVPLGIFGVIALALLAVREWRGRRRTAAADDEPPPSPVPPRPQPEDEAAPTSPAARLRRVFRRTPRSERAPVPRPGGLMPFVLVMGGWFVVEVVVLSSSKGIVHPYYASALGPATGAMAGGGALALIRLREGGRWIAAVVLAGLSVGGTIAAQTVLVHRERYLLWLVPVFLIVGALALIAFALSRPLARPALALIFAVFMIVPTAYATTTWELPVEGTFPTAGPKFAPGTGGVGVAGTELRVDRAISAYITTHGATKRFPLLTVASTQAAPYDLMGVDAASLGGYSGSDPALDAPGIAHMVEHHEARYVLLGGDYSTRGGNKATAAVLRACKELSLATWHSPIDYVLDALTLFDCKGDARALRR